MDAGVAGRPRLSRLSPEKRSSSQSSGWVAASLLETYTWNSSYSPLIDFKAPLPRSQLVEVPHVRQLCSWDCGLACVLMVLKTLGVEGCDMKSLGQLCCTTRLTWSSWHCIAFVFPSLICIWTVDLAHLLRRFAVNVAFLTITIGANPNFAVETFYKENMEQDCERVNRLFERAPQVGIQVQWRSITGEELSMLILSGRFLVIALVDKQKLRISPPMRLVMHSQPWLEDLCFSDCCGLSTGYTGHYVVICGYDMDSDEFEIRDPANSSGCGRISLDALDEARKTFGTDEDILLISLDEFDRERASKTTASLIATENF